MYNIVTRSQESSLKVAELYNNNNGSQEKINLKIKVMN